MPPTYAVLVELAFGLGVCEPAEQMAVEGPRSLLMREVPGAFDELPAVRSLDVASGTLGAARQYVRVQRAVQVQRGHLDGSMHPVAITQAVRPGLGADQPAVVLQGAVRDSRKLE